MIDLVLTVMISAFSLAQPGQAAITTNELPPPPGLTGNTAPSKTAQAAGQKAVPEKPAPTEETRSQATAENGAKVVVEDARSAGNNPTASPAPSGAEAAQPTTEEEQAPTSKQAGGSGSPGRVAAFWFILPNRPPANK